MIFSFAYLPKEVNSIGWCFKLSKQDCHCYDEYGFHRHYCPSANCMYRLTDVLNKPPLWCAIPPYAELILAHVTPEDSLLFSRYAVVFGAGILQPSSNARIVRHLSPARGRSARRAPRLQVVLPAAREEPQLRS